MIQPTDICKILYLTMDDTRSVGLTDEDFINLVEDVFIQQGLNEVHSASLSNIQLGSGSVFQATAGYMERVGVLGIEWNTNYPENWKAGLDPSLGVMIINNHLNGLPYAIMDSFYVSIKRKAAVTAVAAKHFARKDSEIVGIICDGFLGKEKLKMLQLVLPKLNKAKIYDLNPTASRNIFRVLLDEFRGDIVQCGSVQELAKDIDVLVSCNTTVYEQVNMQIADEGLPREGVFIELADLFKLFTWGTVTRMDKIVTDDIKRLVSFAGTPYLPYGLPKVYAEQGEVSIGLKAGRENDRENIMSLNLGVALHDIYIGRKIYELAKQKGIGTELEPITW